MKSFGKEKSKHEMKRYARLQTSDVLVVYVFNFWSDSGIKQGQLCSP